MTNNNTLLIMLFQYAEIWNLYIIVFNIIFHDFSYAMMVAEGNKLFSNCGIQTKRLINVFNYHYHRYLIIYYNNIIILYR